MEFSVHEIVPVLDGKRLFMGQEKSDAYQCVYLKYNPVLNNPSYSQIYIHAAQSLKAQLISPVALIGLGSGTALKEKMVFDTMPTGSQMVVVEASAELAALCGVPALVKDILHWSNPLPDLATITDPTLVRVFTLFGFLPQCPPEIIFPVLTHLLRPEDYLLVGANLAQGYPRLVLDSIIPQYDNEETRNWLSLSLRDLHERSTQLQLKILHQDGRACIQYEGIDKDNQSLGVLFRSYRYHPREILNRFYEYGFEVLASHITSDEQEGVWVTRKNS